MTSVTRWLVNTFPPTTAASDDGFKMVLGGILMVIGFKHPYKYTLLQQDYGKFSAINFPHAALADDFLKPSSGRIVQATLLAREPRPSLLLTQWAV